MVNVIGYYPTLAWTNIVKKNSLNAEESSNTEIVNYLWVNLTPKARHRLRKGLLKKAPTRNFVSLLEKYMKV